MGSSKAPGGEKKLPENRKARKRALLFRRESNDRWGSEFTDSIYLIKRDDGTFRLYARKYFDGETITLDRVCGIKNPEDFVRAFSRISDFVDNDGIQWVTEKVALLDRSFARKLESYLEKEDLKEETPWAP